MKILVLDSEFNQLISFTYDANKGELRIGDIIEGTVWKYKLTRFIKLEANYIVFEGEIL